MMITVLEFRGLGEPLGNNMLGGVRRQLDGKRIRVIEVPYHPAFGPIGSPDIMAKSLMASVDEAVKMGEVLIRDAPGAVVLSGYSFGTLIVNEIIKRHPRNGSELGHKIIMGACLADARRKPGRSYGLPGIGGGIFGEYVDDPRLWCSLAWPGDVVTSLPMNSPLREASRLIHWMSLVDPVKWAASMTQELPMFIQSQIGSMADHAFDFVWWQTYFDLLVKTGQMVDGYARLGEHTARYAEKHWRDWQNKPISAIDLLARCINGTKDITV